MQREREAAGPSRPTQTLTETPAHREAPELGGTLRLRGHHTDERRVAWTDGTVDNEKLGRKSSKICCIYHKPRQFDESSSEDSSSSDDSDDTGDEHDLPASRDLQKKKKKGKRKQPAGEGQRRTPRHAHEHDPDHACHDEPVKDGPPEEEAKRKSSPSSLETSPERNAYERGVR